MKTKLLVMASIMAIGLTGWAQAQDFSSGGYLKSYKQNQADENNYRLRKKYKKITNFKLPGVPLKLSTNGKKITLGYKRKF